MKKDVIVTVRGLQDYEDADADSIELTTHGVLYEKESAIYITYKEADESGLGDTKTTVKVEEGRVSIIRFGESATHLIFEEGKKHIAYYDMGFGSLSMGVQTYSLSHSMGEHGGKINIRYAMEINNSLAGENQISITVRSAH
ncbi:MAG: DUF1934 domain-containing protein [Ruminococcaceae bacterium]|nr:DUF1934 domain-containing protein [Oscillospiraceae bacterium]